MKFRSLLLGAIGVLAIYGVVAAQSSTQGGGFSTKAIQALEECFDQNQNFICGAPVGGVTTLGGTTNTLAKFTGSETIGDSRITDDGSSIDLTTDLVNIIGAGQMSFSGNGIITTGQNPGDTLFFFVEDAGQIGFQTVTGAGRPNFVLQIDGEHSAGESGNFLLSEVFMASLNGADNRNHLLLETHATTHTGAGNNFASLAVFLTGAASPNLNEVGFRIVGPYDTFMEWNDGGVNTSSFDLATLTGDHTYTFPDATGTVLLGSALTNNTVPQWSSSSNTLVDSNIEYNSTTGEVFIGPDNTVLFFSVIDRTAPGTAAAVDAFWTPPTLTVGNRQMAVSRFSLDGSSGHVGINNVLASVWAEGPSSTLANVSQFGLYSTGAPDSDIHMGSISSGTYVGRVSSQLGMDFSVINFPSTGSSTHMFEFQHTMTAGDTGNHELLHVDITNANVGSSRIEGIISEIDAVDADGTEFAYVARGPWDAYMMWENVEGGDQGTFTAPITGNRTWAMPDGSGTVFLSTLATNAPEAINSVWGSSNGITFEGSSLDDNEGTLLAGNPSADRTWTFPDAGGTIQLEGQVLVADSIVQASLPASADGSITYCSDCNPDATCTGSGSGAFAFRIAGSWACELN